MWMNVLTYCDEFYDSSWFLLWRAVLQEKSLSRPCVVMTLYFKNETLYFYFLMTFCGNKKFLVWCYVANIKTLPTYLPTPCNWVAWVQLSPKYSRDKRWIISALLLYKPRLFITLAICSVVTSVAVFAFGHNLNRCGKTLPACEQSHSSITELVKFIQCKQ